jgi:hypothetical protein
VRSLLSIMYPSMPMHDRKECMGMLHADERITFELFDDLIVRWRQYVREHDPKGTWNREVSVARRLSQSVTVKGFGGLKVAEASSSSGRLSLRRAPNREGAEQEANKLQGVPTIAPAASAAPASPDSAATASPDAAATAAAANTRYAYAAAPSAPEIAPRHRRRARRSHQPLASTAPASPAAPVATLPPPT